MAKVLTSFILLLCVQFSVAQTQTTKEIQWVSLEKAQELVKASPEKKIMIFFYTDWCDYCARLKATTLKDQDIIDYINTHFYPVMFNAESKDPVVFNGRQYINPKPGEYKSKHRFALSMAVIDRAIGFPTFVFLNEELKGIMPATRGYKSVAKLEKFMRFAGDQIYKKQSFEAYRQTFISQFDKTSASK